MKIDKYRAPVQKAAFDYKQLTYFEGKVEVEGETVRYEGLCRDIRTPEERERDRERRNFEGNVQVVIPGHAQTVDGPRELCLAAARLSRSGIVWCIDPIPAEGGDIVEAKAVALAVRATGGSGWVCRGVGRRGCQ